MILTFRKATKKKCSKHILLNSILEKTDVWKGNLDLCYSSLVHRLVASASPGSLSEIHTLGPCPRPTESELAFQPDLLVIQIGPELFPLRPTDPSCQILAKLSTNCFSLPQESMYVGSESLLLFTNTIRNISMLSLMSVFFLHSNNLYSSLVHFKQSHFYYHQNISDFDEENW